MPKTTDVSVPDLTGQRALVTGASDGVGLRIATRLARAGAEVVLPVRNPTKGEAAARAIRSQVDGAVLDVRSLDLASLTSVTALSEDLVEEGRPITMLVNNAGLMTPPSRQVTEDGYELQLATNHLGHVALTARLLPLLRAGAARVVSQISIAANSNAVHWDDLQWERDYDAMKAYSSSKIAFGLFGLELDRRSKAAGWGIRSSLAHPGVTPTNLLAAQPGLGRPKDTTSVRVIRALSRAGMLVGTPESAALPAVLAATSPDATGGQLYGPRGWGHLGGPPAVQATYSRLESAADAARIWDLSQELAGVDFGA